MDFDKAYQLVVNKLILWVREFVRLLPNMVLAVLILVGGFFIARLFRRLSRRIVAKITHHEAVHNLFASFVYLLTVVVSIFIALSVLKLNTAVNSFLAGAGIIGIALAFAFQDIAANFMAGIIMAIQRPLKIGDLVKTNDYMGKVITINLRDTIIKTFQGQLVVIPNKEIFQKSIENFSRSGKRRLDLSVGISYGEDLDKVKQVTLDAVKAISVLESGEGTRLFYESFADSSINLTLQIWINSPEQPVYLQARSEAIMLIKKAYDDNNISIPYPIRTLDFGMKGGEKLSDLVLHMDGK